MVTHTSTHPRAANTFFQVYTQAQAKSITKDREIHSSAECCNMSRQLKSSTAQRNILAENPGRHYLRCHTCLFSLRFICMARCFPPFKAWGPPGLGGGLHAIQTSRLDQGYMSFTSFQTPYISYLTPLPTVHPLRPQPPAPVRFTARPVAACLPPRLLLALALHRAGVSKSFIWAFVKRYQACRWYASQYAGCPAPGSKHRRELACLRCRWAYLATMRCLSRWRASRGRWVALGRVTEAVHPAYCKVYQRQAWAVLHFNGLPWQGLKQGFKHAAQQAGTYVGGLGCCTYHVIWLH